jgi:hypothetical protein
MNEALGLIPSTTKKEKNKQTNKKHIVGRQWLIPAILVTQEAEIRRIVVRSQPRQIILETVSQKNLSQK